MSQALGLLRHVVPPGSADPAILEHADWAAQMESSSAAHPGGGERLGLDWKPYQNAIYGVPLWMPVKVLVPKPMQILLPGNGCLGQDQR